MVRLTNQRRIGKYPHRLIDLKDPAESYSAAEFCKDALAEIADIRSNGRIPLLVGGTMMYFKSLVEGISPLPEADVNIRQQIEKEALAKGWEHLHEELAAMMPFLQSEFIQTILSA